MSYKPFKVYNADNSNVATKIFGGKASGIRDWDNVKFPAMLQIHKNLSAEYWTEDEVKLGKDIEQYNSILTEKERYVYNTLSGMLNELDSIATDFNMYLCFIVTDPSIRSVISEIMYFENLHNRSYQYLTSTMLNGEQKHQAFEEIKQVQVLQHRNRHVYDKIEEFIGAIRYHIINNTPIDDKFLEVAFKGILAYQLLEGLHFSGAFVYFHSLARDQKMIGSNDMISLIKTDETQHSEFYGTLIRMIMGEFPQLNTKENHLYALEFVKEAVKREKEWAQFIFNGIETMSLKEYQDYIEYLANLICRNAGFEEPFPESKEIKSRWIVTYGSKKRDVKDSKQIVTRQDFLQGNAINYAHEGGEDFDL
ncbi:ribonucleotide-diphosphate reductase subunit beta [Bacillus pseudomycoides]|nr:ribonucleotide-diphosphate reductase subunit beta [Bacillus pseudomycoides]